MRAFTLLETLVVIVILGIVAAVVVPRFATASTEARTASAEATLAAVRGAIAEHRTRMIVAGDAPFPSLAQLAEPGVVLRAPLPANPFTGVGGVQGVSQAQAAARQVVGTGAGWNYFVDNDADPPVAVFYANSADPTTAVGTDGQTLAAGEL